MTTNTNPAAMFSVSSTTRTDAHTTLPIEPMYAVTACVFIFAGIVTAVVIALGRGETKRLRDAQARLAMTRSVNNSTIRAGLVVRG